MSGPNIFQLLGIPPSGLDDSPRLLPLGGPLPEQEPEPPPVLPMPTIASEGIEGALALLDQQGPSQAMPPVLDPSGAPPAQTLSVEEQQRALELIGQEGGLDLPERPVPTGAVPLTTPIPGIPTFFSPIEQGAIARSSEVSGLPPDMLAEEMKLSRSPLDATASADPLDQLQRAPANWRAIDEVQGIRLPEETRQESAARMLQQATSLDEPATMTGQELSTDLTGRFVPLVGELLDARDAIRSFREGDFGMAGLNAAAAMIPLIPGSTAIRRGLSQLKPRQRVKWAEDFLRNNKPEPWVPTPRGAFDRSLMKNEPFYEGDEIVRFQASKGKRGLGTDEVDQLARSSVTKRVINQQVERGLPLGGETFYQTQPVVDFIRATDGPYSAEDVMWAIAVSSPQTELPSNIANMSLLLRGTKMGLDPADGLAWRRWVRDEFPGKGHQLIHAGESGKLGSHLASWRDWRRGGLNGQGGLLATQAVRSSRPKITAFGGGLLGEWRYVPVDTHELGGATIFSPAYHRYAIVKKLRPAEYMVIEKLYQTQAARMGKFPTQFQGGRWFGGGEITGLRSPRGDFVQQLEDVLWWNAKNEGLTPDPQTLQNMFAEVIRGDRVLLPPKKVVSGAGARAPYLVPGVNVDF